MKRMPLLLSVFLLCLLCLIGAPSAFAQEGTTTPVLPAGSATAAAQTANPLSAKQNATPTLACPGAPRTRLIVRERARVTLEDDAPLNVREGAGTSFEVIAQIEPGEILFVLSGPTCSQRYAWYRIAYEDIEGWIAEGTTDAYFVEIYPPE
ncbi:MAG: SH3 domain-containing protein [Anaerolineae bacterium]|nr:SH3 domain-containing protein [Anaerolineae bacterium]